MMNQVEQPQLLTKQEMALQHNFQQQAHPPLVRQKSEDAPNIRNVWVENLEDELPIISDLLDQFPYVAIVKLFLS